MKFGMIIIQILRLNVDGDRTELNLRLHPRVSKILGVELLSGALRRVDQATCKAIFMQSSLPLKKSSRVGETKLESVLKCPNSKTKNELQLEK